MTAAGPNVFHAFFRVEVNKNTYIRLHNGRAVKIHCGNPFKRTAHALISDGGVIISVAHNVGSAFDIPADSAFRAYVVGNPVGKKHCRKLVVCARVFRPKTVAHHSAKAACGGLCGVVNAATLASQICRKKLRLSSLSASVNTLYYNKKSFFTHNSGTFQKHKSTEIIISHAKANVKL